VEVEVGFGAGYCLILTFKKIKIHIFYYHAQNEKHHFIHFASKLILL
jgi:hypothetical protein